MKSIITESPKAPKPTGARLMRDKRDGQVILVTLEGHYISVSERPQGFCKREIGKEWMQFASPDCVELYLEPFNGSVTLSN